MKYDLRIISNYSAICSRAREYRWGLTPGIATCSSDLGLFVLQDEFRSQFQVPRQVTLSISSVNVDVAVLCRRWIRVRTLEIFLIRPA